LPRAYGIQSSFCWTGFELKEKRELDGLARFGSSFRLSKKLLISRAGLNTIAIISIFVMNNDKGINFSYSKLLYLSTTPSSY